MINIPLVSVLMTSYNREKYIGEAIESVLAQSYENFELIIVDDCSSDKTVAISRQYELKDNRVKVFLNEVNLGDYPNRNKAASLAKGKYLKYVDADDFIYPWGLEILVNSMEQFPEAGWGLCSLDQDTDYPFPIILPINEIFEYHHFKSSLFHKAPLSAIIKRDVFEKAGGFSGKRQMSDTEMWHLLAMKYPVVLLPHGIVWYREHDSQESVQIRSDLKVRIRYTVAKLHFYQQVKSIPISNEKRKIIINKLRKELYLALLTHFIKLKLGSCYTIIKSWRDHSFDFKIVAL